MQRVKRTPSSSNLNAVLFSQTAARSASNSFVIRLKPSAPSAAEVDQTGAAYPLYVICVMKLEQVSRLPSFVPADQDDISPNTASPNTDSDRYTTVAPRCYCIVSYFPFFELFFDILYHILELEHINRLELDFRLQDHESAGESGEETSLLPSGSQSVLKLINKLYELPIPFPGDVVTLNPPTGNAITFRCPKGDVEGKLIGRWSFPVMFRLMSLKSVIALFIAVMLEKQIIVCCPNLGMLSAFCMALAYLVRPQLNWEGLLIPILPWNVIECLGAPIPYIVGLGEELNVAYKRLSSGDDVIIGEDVIFVDPLADRIVGRALPTLPEHHKLVTNLQSYYSQLQQMYKIDNQVHMLNPLFASYKERELVTKVYLAITRYKSWMLGKLRDSFGTYSSSTVHAIQATIVKQAAPGNRAFLAAFMDTQMFSTLVRS